MITMDGISMEPKTILDCCMKKLPSNRLKARLQYRVKFTISNDGKARIDYHPKSRKSKIKYIQMEDLLFSDKKHDIDVKYSFSIYTIDKTITFVAQNETIRDEWLQKIREHHSQLYSEMKQYDAIFEASLLSTGLAKTMRINGPYRIALCKESLDLVPYYPQKIQEARHQEKSANSGTGAGQDGEPAHKEISTRKPISHKRHPYLSSKTIELSLRTIRRVGHSSNQFFLESGRQSQIGEGDLWMTVNKNSTARLLHELLLAAMRLASTIEDHFISRPPRSRSGSSTVASNSTSNTSGTNSAPPLVNPASLGESITCSSDFAVDSISTNTVAAASSDTTPSTTTSINNNIINNNSSSSNNNHSTNNNNNNNTTTTNSSSSSTSLSSIITSTKPHFTNNNIEDDSAYTPMA